MFRTLRSFHVSLLLLALACLGVGGLFTYGQGTPRTPRMLSEADVLALIAQQTDDHVVIGRIEKSKLAFTMDDATLARLKQANPSPAVIAALAALMPMQAIEQPNVNAGKGTWERQDSGVKAYLRGVAFIDDKVGVAVGDNATVIRTTDSGKTWQRAYQPKKGDRTDDLTRVLFSSKKEGWIISGIANTILHTNDAGATWNRVKLPSMDGRFQLAGTHNCNHAAAGSSYFYLCWGLSGSHLFQTDDAGNSWKVLTSKIKVSAAGLSIPDGKHGVFASRIGGSATDLGRTSDGGSTWEVEKVTDSKLSRGNFAQVQMVDKDRGWFIPHFGTIHATTDGGKTWTAQELGHVSTSDLVALHFLDAQRGHVLCNHYPGEVRRTTDGGKSWKPVGKLSNTDHLSSMNFPTMQHGWIVGDHGYIAHYSETKPAVLERMLESKTEGKQTR